MLRPDPQATATFAAMKFQIIHGNGRKILVRRLVGHRDVTVNRSLPTRLSWRILARITIAGVLHCRVINPGAISFGVISLGVINARVIRPHISLYRG
jgi:hypothetical protein